MGRADRVRGVRQKGECFVNRADYLQKNFELSMELREIEKQISGMYNRKKQIIAEMDALLEQMVEEARNGRLYEEE